MGDKPILFSGPMVRAILDGRKSQTRRMLSIRGHKTFSEFKVTDTPGYNWCFRDHEKLWHDLRHSELLPRLKYQVGDRLWCREAWHSVIGYDGKAPRDISVETPIFYCAGPHVETGWVWGKSRPSMFMPRWASRITLLVTDVRVQRLQDILGDDCVAEGLRPDAYSPMGVYHEQRANKPEAEKRWQSGMVQQFHELWDSINGKRPGCAWSDNPWVAAYTFKPILQNIDAITQKDTGHE